MNQLLLYKCLMYGSLAAKNKEKLNEKWSELSRLLLFENMETMKCAANDDKYDDGIVDDDTAWNINENG